MMLPACISLLLFLLYSSAPPRDLHSFPTRRSSDLHRAGAGATARAHADALLLGPLDEVGHHQEVAREAHVEDDGDLDIDRKSTRLNSSHVAISYAVFCLKKKKKKENGRLRTQSTKQ